MTSMAPISIIKGKYLDKFPPLDGEFLVDWSEKSFLLTDLRILIHEINSTIIKQVFLSDILEYTEDRVGNSLSLITKSGALTFYLESLPLPAILQKAIEGL